MHSFNGNTELFETNIYPSWDCYVFKERNLRTMSKGIPHVTKYLSSLNYSFILAWSKKHFYILKTSINNFFGKSIIKILSQIFC